MSYEESIRQELIKWKRKVSREPSLINNFSKSIQTKINSYIPEKVHNAITTAIREMTRGILFGAKVTTNSPRPPDGPFIAGKGTYDPRTNYILP